ncbi:MAG: patatin-like phospholipase RssA [Betaproteobacteria bacterium]|nr:patatin-like phospholipase RssA [Betaproteobacteria bacterium]
MSVPRRQQTRIGLALSSGSARGWAHIGVIKALERNGIVPDVVCGCSVGAFVGAAYVDGDLERLESWVRKLTWQDVVSLLDVSFKSGLLKGERIIQFFMSRFVDCEFSALGRPFGVVATDLDTGREVWLREGSIGRAVRASIAMPGVLTPVPYEGGFLLDGGLVNPVPVSLCRALGADIVIAVDLGADFARRHLEEGREAAEPAETEASWTARLLSRLRGNGNANGDVNESGRMPSLITVMSAGINIMQIRIARSRLAGEPADMLIGPRVGRVGLFDYHRGAESIAAGEAAVERLMPLIRDVIGQ